MIPYSPKERWLDVEIEKIKIILEKLDPIESKEIEPWLFTPQCLEKVIGSINLKFVRKSLQDVEKSRMISYNVLTILFKYLFFKWTEVDYEKSTSSLVKKLINLYGDWWEKPILKKWFEKKTILIKEFGEDFAAKIVASIFLYKYFNKSFLYSSTGELQPDSEYINFYDIIDNMRKNIPGYDEVEHWRENKLNKILHINSYYLCGWIILFFSYIFLILFEETLLIMIFEFFIIFYAYFVFVIIILNSYYILRNIPNFWIKILIVSFNVIFLNYIINQNFENFYFYIISSICWVITIISYTLFKIRTKLLNKNFTYKSFISFYILGFLYLFWSIIFLLYPISKIIISEILMHFLEISDYNAIGMLIYIIFLLFFFFDVQKNENSAFSPRIWIRMKLVKPLEIYKNMGILNDFILTITNISSYEVEEITEKLELSKSIEFNFKKFNIKFKKDLDTIFHIISKDKEEIYEIIPKCPKDKVCPILENQLNKFDDDVSENIIIHVDVTVFGLKTYQKLPELVKISLERAERYFNIFKIYNEESYGISVLELTKSLEYLFKILMHIFISTNDVLNLIPSFGDDLRIKGELSIVLMRNKGVKGFPLGFFLKTIKEICSFPDNWKIKQEFINFLKEKLPISRSLLNRLLEVKVIRDVYAHSPGEYITPEQYFDIRELCYEVLNLLEVNLSDINSNLIAISKIEKKKVIS